MCSPSAIANKTVLLIKRVYMYFFQACSWVCVCVWGGVEGVGRTPPPIRQKRSKKVQFFTLALDQGPQSRKDLPPPPPTPTPLSKILASGLYS